MSFLSMPLYPGFLGSGRLHDGPGRSGHGVEFTDTAKALCRLNPHLLASDPPANDETNDKS